MATVQVANTSKRLVSISFLKSGVLLRIRLNPGVTPVEKSDWDVASKEAFTKRYLDVGILATDAASIKRNSAINKEVAASKTGDEG